jgi:tetratricopeptide (TPR) repeat protein
MGGKQWKDRKHILFYGFCLLIITVWSSGCVSTAKKIIAATAETFQNQPQVQSEDSLDQAANMMSKGNYDGALKVYEEVSRKYPRDSPGDRALFDMGILWAYPDNPERNYEKAVKSFRRLLYYYPQSPLRDEARAWTEALDRLIGSEGKIKSLEEKIISYKEQINALKEIDIGIEEKKRKESPKE